MKKNIYLLIVPVLTAILSIIGATRLFNVDWYFFILPILSGISFTFIMKGDKSYRYLKYLVISSTIYAVLLGIGIFAMYWKFLLNKDFYFLITILFFLFFLGGGAGIVFKGFYSLYKKIIDKTIIFAGPALLVATSLFVSYLKTGGTVMSRYYGWPKPFLSFQIKDILDGFLIRKWIFSNYFALCALYDYLLFFSIFATIFFVIKFLNSHFKRLNLNPTPIMFLIILAASAVFLASPGLKRAYVENEIQKAGYCRVASDCRQIEPKCPFGCATYVNKNEYLKIKNMLSGFDSSCVYSCVASTPVCENNKCQAVIETKDALSFDIKSITFSDNTPEIIIEELLKNLNQSGMLFDFSKQAKASLWWIGNGGWNIIDKTALKIVSSGTILDRNRSFASPIAKKLNEQISKIFLDNNFMANIVNSSKSETDKSFYDYILAFEKNETRCILQINGDDGTYSIMCANNFWKAYNEQIPYLKGLNLTNAVVSRINRVGNYANISVNLRRTGHFKIIKIDDGKMKEVYAGQEYPPCDLMESNGVPKEIFINCYEDGNYYSPKY